VKALDTNVLLRLLIEDDADQAERAAQYLLREQVHAPLFVNRIVLCELVWILTRSFRFGRTQTAQIIARILASDELQVEGRHIVRFGLYLFRISRADFADCLIGAANGMLGCERTATFDQRAGELDEFELI
jgi:predicted nucleic-acid-binding protein